MSTITLDRTVAELVLERPARSRVFEVLGIDYCCGGKKTLSEACQKKKIDPEVLLDRLNAADTAHPAPLGASLESISLSALIEDILQSHHDYLRAELPRLSAMLNKVARVHGDREARLRTMQEIFLRFSQELSCHMMKEENILFPAIARMEQTGSFGGACFGTVRNPIAQMEAEHDGAGAALEDLRHLSDGYTPPEWACNTYRALLDGMREMEQNMHVHVHKENNILFPRSIALEDKLQSRTIC